MQDMRKILLTKSNRDIYAINIGQGQNNSVIYNVMQDMVNRRITIDLLLNMAKEQSGCQFIFLTPQNLRSAFNFLIHRT